jgi:hypothetical protein
MNILGLLGNLPFVVFNCPSPSDYYEQGNMRIDNIKEFKK